MFKSKIDLAGKLVETKMPFSNIKAFEKYLKSVDKHYEEVSVIVQEADIFIETDEEINKRMKQTDYCKESNNVDGKVLDIKVRIPIYQEME